MPFGSYIVTLEEEGRLQLWKWDQGKQPAIHKSIINSDPVEKAFFSPDGNYLAIEYKSSKVEVRREGTAFAEPEDNFLKFNNVSSFAFSFNDEYLAVAKDSLGQKSNIKLTNLLTGKETTFNTESKLSKLVSGQLGEFKANNILFLPIDNKVQLVATAEKDNTIRFWDLSGRLLAELESNYGKVIGLDYSNQGNETYLLALEKNIKGEAKIQYWNINQELDPEILMDEACTKLKKNSRIIDDTYKISRLCPQ